MADEFITDLDEVTDFDDDDLSVNETNPTTTPETNKIQRSNILAAYLRRIKYQISRTVSSNNIVVAIKDSDGNNPTTAKPLLFDINGSWRKLSATLSLTINAGTNFFNLGAVEFANLPQQLFLYAGWRASDSSVFLAVSRVPYVFEFGEFSATTTNELYAAYTGSAPASSDIVTVIGRFDIQNSGTASYNWSIPASNDVINRPIYNTSVLSYNPQWTSSGTAPALGNGTLVGKYQISMTVCKAWLRLTAGSTTTYGTGTYTFSLPFSSATFTNSSYGGSGRVFDSSTTTTYVGWASVSGISTNLTNMTTDGAAGAVGATVPVTLATSDQIQMTNEYAIAVQ